MTETTSVERRLPAPVCDVVIERVAPVVDGGRFATKAVVGDRLVVTADVFSHGHGLVRALLRHRRPGTRRWTETPMSHLGNDAFVGELVPEVVGPLEIEVAGEVDELAAWARDAERRLQAGRPDASDGPLGRRLVLEAAANLAGRRGEAAASDDREALDALRSLAARIADDLDLRTLAGLEELSGPLSRRRLHDEAAAATSRFRATVCPVRAAFSSWYELFPRSASPDPARPGCLRDVIDRLEYVAELGFDVLYLPPIHPIGTTARKGKGNSVHAGRDDVGSPWAIGAGAGGHDAVAPELGTIADFEGLVAEAARFGIDIAMDLAFQCSPDHPWVSEHPDWFRHRSDGTIACAENPPKRYEDIYPLDFHTSDREGLWRELHRVTSAWAARGVRIFRVDNPHTKPFAFWEWLIAEIKREHPETIFLSEAFTRPKVMHRLAKVGFDQSYTYFTWRDEKWDLTEYFEEIANGPGRTYFRPNVWPNTPDILARSLQHAGRAGFVARLVLAGGLSANYGIYGPVFELMWNEPAAPGSEEYLHSEKYEVRHHDLDDPRSLRDLVARVNAARKAHRALQRQSGLRFLPVDNEQIIAWLRRDDSGEDLVVGVVNLDPNWVQAGFVELDLAEVGLPAGTPFPVRDLLTDSVYVWQTGPNYVQLDPAGTPAHLLALERP
ncbi:MAG: maltotransferase domain-containing protein [Acidimicrobiales bacterium]